MAESMNGAVESAVESARAAVVALKAEEDRLATELATVKAKRQAAEKLVSVLGDETPRRRRGRPKRTPVETVPV